MQLAYTTEDEAFRDEVRTFLRDNPVGEHLRRILVAEQVFGNAQHHFERYTASRDSRRAVHMQDKARERIAIN